jgi:hypothetical protein
VIERPQVTLVVGASEDPGRYSNMAVRLLRSFGYQVIAFGKRQGVIDDVPVQTLWGPEWKVDTITLYINPSHQKELYSAIISLEPRRVIFNPGTENPEFNTMLMNSDILTEEACTLVLLRTGGY